MKRKADVVVAGGGVTGCGIAYELARRGIKEVAVVEKGFLARGATGRCGGGIRQQWSTENNTRLAVESVRRFERMSEELEYDVEFRQGGYLILAFTEEEVAQYGKNIAMQQRCGLDVNFVGEDEILRIAPQLNLEKVKAATFCPQDGSANPFKITQAYANAAERLGVEVNLFTKVLDIRRNGRKILEVVTDKGTIKTDTVVNAAGSHSLEIARMAGVDLPIRPTRHEIMVSEQLDPLFDCMVISFHHGIYMRQEMHGGILIGMGIPEERESFDIRSSFRFMNRICRRIGEMAPPFRSLNIIRQWAGLYDSTPDAQPILGHVDEVDNFIQCNGFSGHGFMIAPMVVEILAELIERGRISTFPIDNLSLNRFKGKKIEVDRSVV